jgi:general secretion pathway protein B
MSRNGLSLGFSVCAVTIPSVVVIGYLLLQPVSQLQPRQDRVVASESSQVEVAKRVDEQEAKSYDVQFVILNYPNFSKLKALPQPEVNRDQQSLIAEVSSSMGENLSLRTDAQSEPPFSLEELDLSELSPRVAQQVKTALNHRQYNENSEAALQQQIQLEKNEQRYQGRLPALNLQTHMYSNDTQRRWVKINGIEFKEGEALNNLVELILIEPRSVTIRFDNELIKIPALYEWNG